MQSCCTIVGPHHKPEYKTVTSVPVTTYLLYSISSGSQTSVQGCHSVHLSPPIYCTIVVVDHKPHNKAVTHCLSPPIYCTIVVADPGDNGGQGGRIDFIFLARSVRPKCRTHSLVIEMSNPKNSEFCPPPQEWHYRGDLILTFTLLWSMGFLHPWGGGGKKLETTLD